MDDVTLYLYQSLPGTLHARFCCFDSFNERNRPATLSDDDPIAFRLHVRQKSETFRFELAHRKGNFLHDQLYN